MQPLLTGDPTEVGGFVLDGRLGAGGMGVVFRGHAADGTRVAVKLIREEIAAEPDFRARFRREVRAARAVGSGCTAKLLAADADAPRPWLAVEFVDGPSLSDAVALHGPLAPPAVHALAAGLAESLAAIHAAGVVHRDLKPANVILGPDGPKVIDFGIAAVPAATSATRSGLVIGSPGYMSPEQITGAGTGPPSDVFSWGLTIAFAATGRPPYGTADQPESLLYRVVHGTPDLDGMPATVDVAVRAAVAHEPSQRPTPDGLLRLLLPGARDPYAAATTVLRDVWPNAVPLHAPRPRTSRRRLLASAAAVVLVAAAATGGYAIATGSPATPQPQPTAAPAPAPEVPRFTGPIDTAAEASAFGEFLFQHDGSVVYADVQRVEDGPTEQDHLTLEDECPLGEPRPAGGCGGTNVVLADVGPATDSIHASDGGFRTLRGHFAVTALPGIQMGYLSVRLRAVPATEVR
ncbi:serine/threonine-protein kinase [Pseudonocardia sp. TRM90224]|uniref:serine/threonine-protein kinase n=1 Tax=Pseudonocardia sp. TRM90224 TaxID=2812678 RepID=UPI001E4FCE42|nr:serine/threonine-protein kinase [Pseudonocardia sp. TRM90224]